MSLSTIQRLLEDCKRSLDANLALTSQVLEELQREPRRASTPSDEAPNHLETAIAIGKLQPEEQKRLLEAIGFLAFEGIDTHPSGSANLSTAWAGLSHLIEPDTTDQPEEGGER